MSLLKEKVEVGLAEAELKAESRFLHMPVWMRWVTAIFVIAILPSYFVSKSLSQNYWAKMLSPFSESVKAVVAANAKPLDLKNISLTSLDKNTFSAVAIVANDNLDLSADDVAYNFQLFDAQNNLITPTSGDTTGQTFFLPNQTQYIVLPRVVTATPIASVNLQFDSSTIHWQNRLSIPAAQIITGTPQYYEQLNPLAFVVEGSYQNNSPYDIQNVQLVFLAYDKNNNIIAISERTDNSLVPYEQRSYKQLWPNVYTDQVQSVKVIGQVDTLDNTNLTLPPVPSSTAGSLSR